MGFRRRKAIRVLNDRSGHAGLGRAGLGRPMSGYVGCGEAGASQDRAIHQDRRRGGISVGRRMAVLFALFSGFSSALQAQEMRPAVAAQNPDGGNLSARLVASDKPAEAALQPLTILSGQQAYEFHVELARTDRQRMRGLMYRRSLPDDGGMLFDYGRDAEIAMWMRNTFIPLDMLFIDRRGVVRHIHEKAIPHDETPIPSGGPVRAVLELKGGTVARLGIRVGDQVRGALFTGK